MTQKKLVRSKTNRMIAGVAGGMADYFNIDVTVLRLGFVIFTFVSGGTGILLYLIAIFIIPEEK